MNVLSPQFHDQDKKKLHRIADWLEKLSQYTQIRDERITKNRFAELTLMLSRKFPSGVFCYESMSLIAENRVFFPVFAELCADLKGWLETERMRRISHDVDKSEYETDRFRRLSETAQALVKSFRINQSRQWRLYAVGKNTDDEELNPPPVEIQIERENERANWLHDKYPEAWAYLFPKEAEKERKSKDYSRDYTEDNIYNWVKKIYSDPRDKYTDVRLRFIADNIRRYAPHLLDFFEKLTLEMQEKAA